MASLAEGGASKGGTVTRSPEEEHGRKAASLPFLDQQYSRKQEMEAPPFLGRKLLHRGPGERSVNEALEAGSRKGQEQRSRGGTFEVQLCFLKPESLRTCVCVLSHSVLSDSL